MFALTFKYSADIDDLELSKAQIIKQVKQAVDEKRVRVVFISDHELVYSGTTVRFPWRGNFAQSVDKGRFRLLNGNSKILLEYEIYMHSAVYFSV
jgi:hypothetical protein